MAKLTKIISWPVGIGIIYGLFVLILVVFVIFSMFNTVDLVSEDYYTQELKYQSQIDRINRTSSLNTQLMLEYLESEKIINLQFPSEFPPESISGQIVFFRPSDAKLDKVLTINPDIQCSQRIIIKTLQPGLWRIKIFWKVNSSDFYSEDSFIIK
jgi:hypothetical protein